MNHSYVIVIPSTIYNVPAPDSIVDGLRVAVKSALAEAFGGYTEVEATGGYKAESGELIEERCTSSKLPMRARTTSSSRASRSR